MFRDDGIVASVGILTNNDDEDNDTYHTQDDHHLSGPEKVIREDLLFYCQNYYTRSGGL